MKHKLTATKVAKVKEPGYYNDGGNLYLQVSRYVGKDGKPSTSKSWVLRFTIAGRRRRWVCSFGHSRRRAEGGQ